MDPGNGAHWLLFDARRADGDHAGEIVESLMVEGAQAMLHLRSIYLNVDWDRFIDYRIQAEQEELYGQLAA